ncbi:MAG: trypsin-like peptidase domain-containing protein, partial [Candidatus Woesebacteria bacterium]
VEATQTARENDPDKRMKEMEEVPYPLVANSLRIDTDRGRGSGFVIAQKYSEEKDKTVALIVTSMHFLSEANQFMNISQMDMEGNKIDNINKSHFSVDEFRVFYTKQKELSLIALEADGKTDIFDNLADVRVAKEVPSEGTKMFSINFPIATEDKPYLSKGTVMKRDKAPEKDEEYGIYWTGGDVSGASGSSGGAWFTIGGVLAGVHYGRDNEGKHKFAAVTPVVQDVLERAVEGGDDQRGKSVNEYYKVNFDIKSPGE